MKAPKLIAAATALTILGACTSMTPTQQGATTGGLGGAAAGAGIAALAGGNAGVGAAIGGAAGLLAGGLYGHQKEKQQQTTPAY